MMNETTPAVWARIIRVDLDGLVEVCNCARLIVFGGKRAAALPVSLRRARVDTESAILLGDSPIEVLALIMNCATAAITRSVLGIGGYRRIAIVERALSRARWRLYCSARETRRRARSAPLHWLVAIAFEQAASRLSRSAFESLHRSRSSAEAALTNAASKIGNASRAVRLIVCIISKYHPLATMAHFSPRTRRIDSVHTTAWGLAL